jgi:hypothetical protein
MVPALPIPSVRLAVPSYPYPFPEKRESRRLDMYD